MAPLTDSIAQPCRAIAGFLCALILSSCASPAAQLTPPQPVQEAAPEAVPVANETLSRITAVTSSGEANRYQFSVTLQSPDQGCNAYADWWEVVDESGKLLYRRILAHSHVNEQPFTRSGGPVAIAPDQTVIIRAHFNPTGYSPFAYRGSVVNGFEPTTPAQGFASERAQESPLPQGCSF